MDIEEVSPLMSYNPKAPIKHPFSFASCNLLPNFSFSSSNSLLPLSKDYTLD
jgi:hypothetical protein